MKSLGIVRKVDELGRIVIPKEVRRAEGWDAGQAMEMYMSDEGLVIRAYQSDYEKEQLIKDIYDVIEQSNNDSVTSLLTQVIDFVKKN